MIDPRIVHNARLLAVALNNPFTGAKPADVSAGKGKIALAYKAADTLCDALNEPRAPRVTRLPCAGPKITVHQWPEF